MPDLVLLGPPGSGKGTQGRPLAEALGVLERAHVIAQRIGRTHTLARILGNRGDVLLRQGDLAGARDAYEQALAQFETLKAREDLIETRRRLCEVDLAGGRVEAALDRARARR